MLYQLVIQTENGKCIGTKYGRRLYGAMVELLPQTSFKNLEMIISMSHAAMIVDADIPVPAFEKIPASVTLETHLEEILCNCAANSMFEVEEQILKDGAKIFLIADKGAKKLSHAQFVNIIYWYIKTDARVKSFNLDSDAYDGSSEHCAKAVRHALVKLFGPDNVDNILSGQITDSGGGGTGKSFHRELAALKLTAMPDIYLVGYCTLHCIQLTLPSAFKHVLGEGDTQKNGQYKKM